MPKFPSHLFSCVRNSLAIAGLASAAWLALGVQPSLAYDDGGKKYKILFVTSAGPGNPFYGPIIKGFDQAGKDLNVETIFRGDQKTDLLAAAPEVKRMLENAIALKPDGLVVSDTYPEVLNQTIQQAVKSGIPVVLTNGGFGETEHTGALAFVGTDERQLGVVGGQLFARRA